MFKILSKIGRHKIISGIILILLVVGAYFGNKYFGKNNSQTSYVLAAVEKGTIVTSVSGSGQVVAEDQISVKSQVSGKVSYIGVKNDQAVKAGALLVSLDTTDAKNALEDAKTNLDQAELALQKLEGTTTDLGTLRGIKEKATDDLNKAYTDSFNNVSNIFLELPNIISGLQNMLFSYDLNSTQWNIDYYADAIGMYDADARQYRSDVYNKYQIARVAYDKNFQDYKSADLSSAKGTIESLVSETYETVANISDTIKSMNNLVRLYQDIQTKLGAKSATLSNTHLSTLDTYTGETNGYLSNLLSEQDSIQSAKEALIETDFTIATQEEQVEKMQKALEDAQSNLADYTIYSPYAGIVTAMSLKVGDNASANSSIATLVSSQQIAEITLNEIDVAKVKVGQKVNVTFDAIPDLNITGEVADVDTLGTVTQGVVTYTVKISFDIQDERVKPGMSVSATIITEAKQNVLLVPSLAVKSSGNISYVEILSDSDILSGTSSTGVILKTSPKQQEVTTGLSDDTSVEILSGLKEGDLVVTKTTAPSSSSKSSSSNTSNTLLRSVSGGGSRFGPGL